MSNILTEICKNKAIYLEQRKKQISLNEMERNLPNFLPKISFIDAIRQKNLQKKIALIAEVKKSSPSGGVIRENFDHIAIAKSYENAGAACISILTDYQYFKGKEEYITDIAAKVNIPLLRKDFMIDPYQVIESKFLGANCILLIMAAIEDSLAKELEDLAFENNLDVLIEIHSLEELERALKLKTRLIGINNRNLKTLKVDLQHFANFPKHVPSGYVLVCESGIKDNNDIKFMTKNGANAFLVGESLMRSDDIESATRKLIGS